MLGFIDGKRFISAWCEMDSRFRVLEEWCPAFPGFHLYYPSRLQLSPAMGDATNALNNAMSSHNMDAKGRDLAKGLVGMK